MSSFQREVKVPNVYEGTDLILYANGGDLEYDFDGAPGANPEQIQLPSLSITR